MWKNTREIDGAIVDGMDLVLQTKADRDLKKETFWAELRKRSEVYERVDMSDMYQYLINGSDGHELQGLPEIYQKLQTGLESVQSKDISAYEIINAKSLVRAAEDIELSGVRVRQQSFETEDAAILEHSDAGSAKLNLELDSKLNGLGSAALLLDSLWAGNAIDMESQAQLHISLPNNDISDSQPARGSRRKTKQTDHSTERSAAWPAASPAVSATAPLLSHSRREASAAVYMASSSAIDVFASSQKPSSSTQPKAIQAKKKKARKSGF
ncbi:hypothetical protein IW147_004820 [Coemansia sp. RSA 720]|nr:hypothetical protein IW147_004820 [Coemansia sp. RSA 720]